MKNIKMILAMSDNGKIGCVSKNEQGTFLPWSLRTDMGRFRKLTSGSVVVMGRKTWDTLDDKFRPLPNRENLILTRDPNFSCPGTTKVSSVEEVLEFAMKNPDKTIWIIGGTEIYQQFSEHVSEIHLTRVHGEFFGADIVDGPNLNIDKFGIPKGLFFVSEELVGAGEKDSHPSTYKVFKKVLSLEDMEGLRKRAIKMLSEGQSRDVVVESPYEDLMREILLKGKPKTDRTGTGTVSLFGKQMRFDLSKGFPLITTKKLYVRAIIHELLWFLQGNTNIQYLVKNNVTIWDDWPYAIFKKSSEFAGETLDEFSKKIANEDAFAAKWGELGPVYGKQWRSWEGANGRTVDQIVNVVNQIKTSPDSRRLIVSAWNVPDIDKMALPPCHCLFQFYVSEGKLSCQLYQRSADYFLGVPFNIASYALLTMMIAQVCELGLGEFIHTFGDVHLYANHFDQIVTQLRRYPYANPVMEINPRVSDIFDFKYEDFKLVDYRSHETISAPVAV